MDKWKLSYIQQNLYELSLNNNFIRLKVNHTFNDNVEINISNKDMSKDYIVFINQLYPSRNTNNAIIGNAYRFNNYKCIDESLIDVEIIDSNISDPKSIVEGFWL